MIDVAVIDNPAAAEVAVRADVVADRAAPQPRGGPGTSPLPFIPYGKNIRQSLHNRCLAWWIERAKTAKGS